MQLKKRLRYLSLILVILFSCARCDIKKSDIPDERNFIRIYHDSDFNNEYHPLDIVALNDGFLILASQALNSDSTNFDWNYQKPYIIKTTLTGDVEWTITGEDPYVSPIADILEINKRYYFFTLHKTSLAPTLMEVNLDTKSMAMVSSGEYGTNAYALKSICDDQENILLLTNDKTGTKNSNILKISGATFSTLWKESYINSANDGENIIIPAILEQLSHYGQQYPYSIKLKKMATNTANAYFVNSYYNTQLSLNTINANGTESKNLVTGSRNKVFIAAVEQLNDSVVAIVKNDNGEISIQADLVITEETRLGIEDINGTTSFREMDGSSLIVSESINYNENDYLILAGASKGEQVTLIIYNVKDYTLHTMYFIGSSNNIEPLAIKRSGDDALLILCKTLVTNKYPRIALYKIPFEEVGL